MDRGEVWLINLNPVIGAEMQKTRPCVIVNDNGVGILPLKVVVPLTEWKDRYATAPWMVRLDPNAAAGLEKTSAADAFQVRSVAHQRLVRRLGALSETKMREIGVALSIVLGLPIEGNTER